MRGHKEPIEMKVFEERRRRCLTWKLRMENYFH